MGVSAEIQTKTKPSFSLFLEQERKQLLLDPNAYQDRVLRISLSASYTYRQYAIYFITSRGRQIQQLSGTCDV